MKNIIFIAPLPPPLTGQSLTSQVLCEGVKDKYHVEVINFSRKDALKKSKLSLSGVVFIAKMVLKILKFRKKAEIAYFTITQSRFGNMKDLLLLLALGKRVRKKTIIHINGGYFHILFNNSNILIKLFNRYLFKDVALGLVPGESLKICLTPVIDEDKIKSFPNFYENFVKITKEEFDSKWKSLDKINVLYLSNIMKEKGYEELIDAYKNLDVSVKNKVILNFTGNFESDMIKENFFNKIKDENNIAYNGLVKGEEKKKLLAKSHIFILPTYYHIEAQPLSILEAYASGLYVITTDQGGICDIFRDDINGKLIEKRSVESIVRALTSCVSDTSSLLPIAENNLIYSNEFSSSKAVNDLQKLLEEVSCKNSDNTLD